MSDSTADPKRRGGRPAGVKASEAQKAAGRKNLEAAHEKARQRKEARLTAPPEKPRWQKLVDGDIAMSDLTTKELQRHACANNDGTWVGSRHKLPQRITNAMDQENHRRERRILDKLVRPALRALKERMEDSDAPAQQLGAAKVAIEYRFGKPVEVVHHGVETEFDRLSQSAFVIRRGADLAAELEAHQEPQQEHDPDDVVEAELVEEEA